MKTNFPHHVPQPVTINNISIHICTVVASVFLSFYSPSPSWLDSFSTSKARLKFSRAWRTLRRCLHKESDILPNRRILLEIPPPPPRLDKTMSQIFRMQTSCWREKDSFLFGCELLKFGLVRCVMSFVPIVKKRASTNFSHLIIHSVGNESHGELWPPTTHPAPEVFSNKDRQNYFVEHRGGKLALPR